MKVVVIVPVKKKSVRVKIKILDLLIKNHFINIRLKS